MTDPHFTPTDQALADDLTRRHGPPEIDDVTGWARWPGAYGGVELDDPEPRRWSFSASDEWMTATEARAVLVAAGLL
jgi:hypothetical protein